MAEMQPHKVKYCHICTMPPEYCEFSGTQEKCKDWLKDNDEELYESLYGEQVATDKVEKMTLQDSTEIAPGHSDRTIVKDKSAKLEAKLERENKKKQSSPVTIKRIERTKRKCVTAVHGLEVFDVDLKKAAKIFANKFACGSSVAKNNQNLDEIVVQGDVSEELQDLILEKWPQVPKENFEFIDDKKKK